MSLILIFLVFIVLQSANAQSCAPGPVINVVLDVNYILSWSDSTDCVPDHYLIYVKIEPDNMQYIFGADERFIELPFLPSCERFLFEIRAFSSGGLSTVTRYITYIPAPPEADLTITTFEATSQQNGTFLRWLITERYAHCAREFRVVIYDEYNGPRDVYTPNNYLFINDLIPCARYQFAVMAIYNLATEGPIALINYEVPQAKSPLPFVERVSATDTYVEITWSFPTYGENQCSISMFELEGLPYYHQQYPVVDSPARPLFITRVGPLQPESMYVFHAYIINTAGSSNVFPFGVQTRSRG